MRRCLFFVLFLCQIFVASHSWAQSAFIANLNLPIEIETTIIREHVYPTTISFVEGKNGNFFIYADDTLNATIMPVDPSLVINDFVIDNDSVFFCGRTSADLGVIGFFDINDYFWGTHNYYIVSNTIFSADGKVTNLNKLVSYFRNGIRHIVTIGKTSQGLNCVVNTIYDLTGNWNYQTGSIPSTSKESLVDITTDDYSVITSGLYWHDSYNPSLGFRVYDKGNVFNSSDYRQDYISIFSDAAAQKTFCLDQVVSKQLSCNQIVVAAYWKNYTDTTIVPFDKTPKGLFIGRFSIVWTPKDWVAHDYSILCYNNYYLGKWKLFGFSDVQISNSTINLLHEYNLSLTSSVQSVIFELSDNILQYAGVIPYATTTQYRFKGIGGYYSSMYYFVNGIPINNPYALSLVKGYQGFDSCLERDEIPTEAILLNKQEYCFPFSLTEPEDVTFVAVNTAGESENFEIHCSE